MLLVVQPNKYSLLFNYLNFLFDCHAVATNGWEIRDCDPNGPSSSDCLSLAQMVAIHTLGDSWSCLNGDGLAEVLGSAIALNLLFGIPIMVAILVTILDVFLLLLIMKLGFKKSRLLFQP